MIRTALENPIFGAIAYRHRVERYQRDAANMDPAHDWDRAYALCWLEEEGQVGRIPRLPGRPRHVEPVPVAVLADPSPETIELDAELVRQFARVARRLLDALPEGIAGRRKKGGAR